MATSAPSAQPIELSAAVVTCRPTPSNPLQGLRPAITQQDNRADLDDNDPMRLFFALAGAAIAVGLAVPALAGPAPTGVPDNPAADATFLDSLNKAGMTYTNGSSAIAAGRCACDMMNSGRRKRTSSTS